MKARGKNCILIEAIKNNSASCEEGENDVSEKSEYPEGCLFFAWAVNWIEHIMRTIRIFRRSGFKGKGFLTGVN